jgi:hypothetical protein
MTYRVQSAPNTPFEGLENNVTVNSLEKEMMMIICAL